MGSLGPVPTLDERSITSADGVLVRQWDPGDVGQRLVVLGGVPATEIPPHSVRVRADDQQVRARSGAAMAGSGWQHDHVAAGDREAAARRSAQYHVGRSARDPEHLVPSAQPAVRG